MPRDKGKIIFYLLAAVISIQVIILFFFLPSLLAGDRAGADESQVVLQGKVMLSPEPHQDTSVDDNGKPLIRHIDVDNLPAVEGVCHGEGQSAPKSPKSLVPKWSLVPRMTGEAKTGGNAENQGDDEDNYRFIVYGIIILQQEKQLRPTPDQAAKLKQMLESEKRLKKSASRAYKTILATLTDEQLKYIYYCSSDLQVRQSNEESSSDLQVRQDRNRNSEVGNWKNASTDEFVLKKWTLTELIRGLSLLENEKKYGLSASQRQKITGALSELADSEKAAGGVDLALEKLFTDKQLAHIKKCLLDRAYMEVLVSAYPSEGEADPVFGAGPSIYAHCMRILNDRADTGKIAEKRKEND